eukprot:COSAG01_NODE_70653_length_258_cov_0.641509_1_plen_29_part_10
MAHIVLIGYRHFEVLNGLNYEQKRKEKKG